MIRIDTIWLALGASDLRGGIDRLLGLVVHGFALAARHVANRTLSRISASALAFTRVALPVTFIASSPSRVAMAAEGTQFTSSIHAGLPEGHDSHR